MARAKQKSTTKHDPVFAAIEKHRKVMKELYEALKPVAWNNGDPDPKKANKYLSREHAVRDELTATAPTTLQGLLAVLTYINGVTNGPLSPYGKRDNTFEQSDTLMDVFANAEKLLADQLGRAT
jgi:hypothetical protein